MNISLLTYEKISFKQVPYKSQGYKFTFSGDIRVNQRSVTYMTEDIGELCSSIDINCIDGGPTTTTFDIAFFDKCSPQDLLERWWHLSKRNSFIPRLILILPRLIGTYTIMPYTSSTLHSLKWRTIDNKIELEKDDYILCNEYLYSVCYIHNDDSCNFFNELNESDVKNVFYANHNKIAYETPLARLNPGDKISSMHWPYERISIIAYKSLEKKNRPTLTMHLSENKYPNKVVLYNDNRRTNKRLS